MACTCPKYLPRHLPIALLLFTFGFIGCSGSGANSKTSTSGSPEAKDGLMDLQNLLIEIKAAGGKLPTKASDLTQHDVAHPAAGALVVNGTIVYLFGATIDESLTPPKLVAMQSGADKSGGWVLLSNGEVKDLPAAEVAALPPGGKLPK